MVRVNHSCPCWCTLLFGVQTKVTNPLKSKKGHYLLLLMRCGIRLFTTTLCVLTWNMFDWGMMNGIRYEIDVLKCGKDKQYSAGRDWKFESLMSGYVHAALRSITCPLGVIDYRNKIIGIGTAVYTTLRLNTEAILCGGERKLELHNFEERRVKLHRSYAVHVLKRGGECWLHV